MFPQVSSAQRAKIVLVEDDENVRRSMALLLRARGFSVQVFRTGTELLNRRTLPDADCLLIDYKMPDVDGLVLLKRLRQSGLAVPALLVTGLFSNTLRARAIEAGFSDVIEKPALGDTLPQKISDLVAKTSGK